MFPERKWSFCVHFVGCLSLTKILVSQSIFVYTPSLHPPHSPIPCFWASPHPRLSPFPSPIMCDYAYILRFRTKTKSAVWSRTIPNIWHKMQHPASTTCRNISHAHLFSTIPSRWAAPLINKTIVWCLSTEVFETRHVAPLLINFMRDMENWVAAAAT